MGIEFKSVTPLARDERKTQRHIPPNSFYWT